VRDENDFTPPTATETKYFSFEGRFHANNQQPITKNQQSTNNIQQQATNSQQSKTNN